MPQKRKKILFVDDDLTLLELIRQVMAHYAGETWEIFTASDVSRALGVLQETRIDLLVIDIHMAPVDGIQFLSLLQRKYPNVLKVVLTGDASEQYRAASLSNGAELFLEKPRDSGGWQTIHATLHELARFHPEEGFRGVLRRVGLQDVLQMECLARNSSILKIHAGSTHGTVFLKDGQIVHAECGSRSGEEAFNLLLGLAGGEFDVQPYVEPTTRSITGSWEFLLMEAARKRDEAGPGPSPGQSDSGFPTPIPPDPSERHTPTVVPIIEATAPLPEHPAPGPPGPSGSAAPVAGRPQIEEMLLCTLQGEVLHEWQCTNTNGRIGFLEVVSQKARQLAQGLPLAEFDRLEVTSPGRRAIAQIQSDRALLVQVIEVPAESEVCSARP